MKNKMSLLFLGALVMSLSSCNLFEGGSTSKPNYDPEYMTPGLIIENGVVTSYEGTDTEVVIPSIHNGYNVTSIGDFAFCYCQSLTSIEIPDSVTSIGNSAFSYCTSLTSITLGNSVTSIGEDAFYNCTSLTSVNVDSNNTHYSSVDGILYDKDATTLIYCPAGKVGEVDIPNTVTSIGDYAFYYCSSLTSINIPNSVTSIGDYAFYYCSSLTSINIPNSVTSIGKYAFEYCYSLTIYCEAESRPSGWKPSWNPNGRPVIWGA